MGTVCYTVVNGEVLSENRDGVERDYLPDTQGNTIGLLDNTQTITDTFSYYPYGEVVSRTGTTATPFQFLGTLGYYRDSASRTYVRARTLNTAQGRWMTQDPIGFKGGDVNLYRYVANRPTVLTDPSGHLFFGISKRVCLTVCNVVFGACIGACAFIYGPAVMGCFALLPPANIFCLIIALGILGICLALCVSLYQVCSNYCNGDDLNTWN